MATFKCKICGGALEIDSTQSVATCEYCGTKQTLPKFDDERRANLYDRANHFRRNNDFDKAMGIYENILNEDNTDAEAYWSIVLCRYGIEYVEDPATHKRVPTVNRAQFTSIFDDEDYKSALINADGYQREIYESEANAINEIQKGFLAISQKEEPFDVFICYKETDVSGRRTQDSVLATELYHELTREGFKVFFSRITLEDKLGIAYEPYIFAALNSAKVMVVVGTRPEHFNAVWVKNEWSRYLALIKNGAKKTLIPAYRNMDACTEMNKVTFTTESKLKTISNYAFTDCVNLSEIQLPTTVTSIGNHAFSGCISIAKINSDTDGEMLLPENVTTIGEYAFKNLELITKVVVPDTVTSIGLGAFKGCNAIEDITLPFVGKSLNANYYDAVFGYIFGYTTATGGYRQDTISEQYENTQYGSISDSVWQYTCRNYKFQDIGTYYKYRSYYYFIPTSIRKVTITAQTSIPTAAFNNCNFIETITIPTTVTSIGDYAFQNCEATVNQTYAPNLSYWNGTDVSTSFLGNGTEADPYQINSAADLAYLASSVNAGTSYAEKHFVLNVDINLDSKSWTPIGTKANPFAGTFDGNGKKIYNLSVTMNVANAGLFGYVSGTMKDLGIVSGTISPASNAASTYAGSLVGYLTGTVENCYSQATVNVSTVNTTYAGGLIGYVDTAASVKDSYASGNVTVTTTSGFAYAGGFVSMNKGTIEGSLAYGNVTAKGQNDSYSRNGGFSAKNDGTLTECYRSETQVLTKYTTADSAYCEDGTVNSYSNMIAYAQNNWNSSIWEYELKYPNHK